MGLSACNTESNREMDENVSIGTHSLHIRCIGQDSPTVVIDTGLGDTLERWDAFQSQVVQFAHVCTYDRAGYGSSDTGPLSRHSQRLADELQQLLENADIRGPYVLLGHSLGGLTMQAFPELYQILEGQVLEYQNMAEAMRESPDAEG